MKISGIYQIQSKIKPERIYIGSAVDLDRRRKQHLGGLCRGTHDNSRLQRHFSKYGKDDLLFSVLLTCDKNELIEKEQFFIDSYKPYFNISPTAGNTLGYRHTSEMIKWFSKTRKGKKFSIEYKEKISRLRKGRTVSYLTRIKISESHKGIKHTEEVKKILSIKHKGKILSEQHRRKISEALKRRIITDKTRKKLSVAGMGHPVSWETRRRLSLANKGKGHLMSETAKQKISEALKGIKRSDKFKEYCRERERKKRLKKLLKN